MDAVFDEPLVFDVCGPVVDAHVRVGRAGADEFFVPFDHAALRVGVAGRDQGFDVDPEHRLVADDRHHLFDPFTQADGGAGGDVGGLVGPQGQHPAAFEAFGLPGGGDFLGVRFAFEALFDRARSLHLHVRFFDPDFGVAAGDPLEFTRQVFGVVEALGGRVADVDDGFAGGSG